MYPAAAWRRGGAVGPQVDNWPKNPWTGVAMAAGATKGDYTYTTTGSPPDHFTLVGHVSTTPTGDFTVP